MVTQIPGAAPATAGLEGTAGYAEDEQRVVLRDGSCAVIRPLATGDVAAITVWFESLGEETRHARFLGGVNRLNDQMCSRLAQVDHWNHEALMVVTGGGTIAGISRYIRLPDPGTAEVAVAVADRWRGRGIASLLLQRITVRAGVAGICCLTALCLRSNTDILRLLGRVGTMTITPVTQGVVEVRIWLPPVNTADHC
jgi:GNAT superfamily N-acetyltransferase